MTPIHPCGKVIDLIRDPYRASMLGYHDSGERMEVRWFEAPPEAEWIEGESVYRSSYWYDPQSYTPDCGELPSRRYDNQAGGNPLGYLGRGDCGSAEAFARGGYLDIDPPLDILADGSSACCRMATMVAEGGQQQGTARVEVMQARGGQQQYGQAEFFHRPMTAGGGQQQGKVPPPPRFTASGGQRQGGSAQLQPGHRFLATGGQRQGGSAQLQPGHRFLATGGQRQGGSAQLSGAARMTAAGGQDQGGAAPMSGSGPPPVMTAAGGQEQGGVAEYGPVGTVPTACCGSTLVPATCKAIITGSGSTDGTYTLTWAGGVTQHWDYTGPFGTITMPIGPVLTFNCGGIIVPAWQFTFNPGLSMGTLGTVHCAPPFRVTFSGVNFAVAGGGVGNVEVVGV